MMLEVEWHNAEQTIIYVKFLIGWQWSDLHDAVKEVHALIETVEHEVYVIADMLDTRTLPDNATAHFGSLSIKLHSRMKLLIDVTDSMFVRIMTSMFQKLQPTGKNVVIANSLEEAFSIIEKDRVASA